MVINSITKVPVMKFVLLMVLHYVIMNTIATNHGSSWFLSNACPIKSQPPEKTESNEGEKDMDISPNACEYHFIDLK